MFSNRILANASLSFRCTDTWAGPQVACVSCGLETTRHYGCPVCDRDDCSHLCVSCDGPDPLSSGRYAKCEWAEAQEAYRDEEDYYPNVCRHCSRRSSDAECAFYWTSSTCCDTCDPHQEWEAWPMPAAPLPRPCGECGKARSECQCMPF